MPSLILNAGNFPCKFLRLKQFFKRNMETAMLSTQNLDEKHVIKEGQAEIFIPHDSKVFYNPVQEFNRDLSVLTLQILSKHFEQNLNKDLEQKPSKTFRILEALSATGLRSIRYAKEVPYVEQVVANDLSAKAVETIKQNIKHNQVENLVEASNCNAVSVMYNHSHPSLRFQAVDLDPYGCPAQFLDSAVQCVADGGILMVTCTDMAVLCGVSPETCYVKYGALPLKVKCRHEMAIRIALQHIQSHASRHKRYIVPILSVSVDFYIRVFVKIFTSALNCKKVPSKLAMIYHCKGCDSMTMQPLGITKKDESKKNVKYLLPTVPTVGMQCMHCGGNHQMGGPIWIGPIHDQNFVSEMLNSKEIHEFNTSKRLLGILSVIREELYDVPLFHDITQLCSTLKSSLMPMMVFRSAILNAGYRVSFSHAYKTSVKTDAPMSFIWDILKTWVKNNPITKIIPGTPADVILNSPIQHEIDFSLRPDANPLSRESKLTRFQMNPLPFWGPGTKSVANSLVENEKKFRNQNKKKGKRKETNDKISYPREKEPKLAEDQDKNSDAVS